MLMILIPVTLGYYCFIFKLLSECGCYRLKANLRFQIFTCFREQFILKYSIKIRKGH